MPRQIERKLTTIQIPQEDAKQLDEIAERLTVPRQAVIRWAIRAYLESPMSPVSLNSTVDDVQQADPTELAAA
jgi:predicted DNA-binding protein